MPRYFLHCSYDGTAYHGWQRQPNGLSVQAVIEDGLQRLLKCRVSVVAAGRTDTGVHARHMVAHFDTSVPVDLSALTFRLNALLPQDIAVQNIEEGPTTKHARYSAVRRTYKYYIHTAKNPFLRTYSQQIHYHLDIAKMNAAAHDLLGTHDFVAFAKRPREVPTTLCTVYSAAWTSNGEGQWVFTICANRFLRNMVRAIVGTLIDIGRGAREDDEIRVLLTNGTRSAAGDSMPGHALFLHDVEY